MHLTALIATSILLLGGLGVAVPPPEDLRTISFAKHKTGTPRPTGTPQDDLGDVVPPPEDLHTISFTSHATGAPLTVSQCLIPGGCGSTGIEVPTPPTPSPWVQPMPTVDPKDLLTISQCLIPGGCGSTGVEWPQGSPSTMSAPYAPGPTPKGPKHSLTRTPELAVKKARATGAVEANDAIWPSKFLPEDGDAAVPPPEDMRTIQTSTPALTVAAPAHSITRGVIPLPVGHSYAVPSGTETKRCMLPPPFTCKTPVPTETFTPVGETTTLRTVRV